MTRYKLKQLFNNHKISYKLFLGGLFCILSFFILFSFLEIENEQKEVVYNINLEEGNNDMLSQDFDSDIMSFAVRFQGGDRYSLNEHYVYRYLSDGDWSDWEHFDLDGDHELYSDDFYSKLHFLSSASSIQLKPEEEHVKLNFDKISILAFQNVKSVKLNFDSFTNIKSLAKDGIEIITREEWGADESLRFYDPANPPASANKIVEADDEWMTKYADEIKIVRVQDRDPLTGQKLIWPLEYTSNFEKIIVHHSAGKNPTCSEEEDFLRSIYKFHTVTRGWGDIGYNYIIGPCSGKIYQGRAGEHTKGAHAGKFNAKTVGVMTMGNFQYDVASDVLVDSMVDFLRYLSEIYGIWPDGYSEIRGLYLPNIIGHRDVSNTSCPGDNLESLLPNIRTRVLKGFNYPKNPYYLPSSEDDELAQKRKESFSAVPVISGTNQIFLKPGDTSKIKILFKNVGKRVWNSQSYLKISGSTLGLKFNDVKKSDNIASMKEKTVAPDRIATFETNITAGKDIAQKEFIFEFVPYINGLFEDKSASQKFIVIILDESTKSVERSKEEESVSDEISPKPENKEEQKIVTNTEEVKFFADVTSDNIYFAYIEDLWKRGIVNGNNGMYNPWKEVTRGEFSKILVKSANLKLAENSRSFLDISGNTFEEFIRILQSHDIVQGQKGMFYPNSNISRAEAVTMTVKAFRIQAETLHTFKDMKGSVFEDYVKKAAGANIIGKGNIFDPNSPITRDQVSKIISNAIKYHLGSSIAPTNTEDTSKEEKNERGPLVRLDLNFLNSKFEITSDKKYSIWKDGKIYKESLDGSVVTTIVLKDDKYEIKIGDNLYNEKGLFVFVPSNNGIMEIKNEARFEKNSVKYNRYRGKLEVRVDPDDKSKMYLVNILPLEDYVLGLGEEPDGQEIEKMKAIFVMARSYIEYYRNKGGKFPERKVDLKSDGATSQVYLGVDFESRNESVVKVANITFGEVITYDGEVIRAPYFSRSGGHTITPGTEGNTWNPSSFPFAKRVEDPWSCDKDLNYLKEYGPIECKENMRGHGVGVSAWGAKEMAKEGKTYKEILKYYLDGIEFKKMY